MRIKVKCSGCLGVAQDGRKDLDIHPGIQGSGGKGVPQSVKVNQSVKEPLFLLNENSGSLTGRAAIGRL